MQKVKVKGNSVQKSERKRTKTDGRMEAIELSLPSARVNAVGNNKINFVFDWAAQHHRPWLT